MASGAFKQLNLEEPMIQTAENEDLIKEAYTIRGLLEKGKPRNGRPLNILLLGNPGAGKSSFINSMIAAIDKEGYVERARTGRGGGAITPGLERIQVFENPDDYPEESQYKSKPCFWDFAGLYDSDESPVLQSLLRGQNCAGKRLEDMKGIWATLKNWWTGIAPEERRMHLVIYVHAAEHPPSETLLKTIQGLTDPISQTERNVTLMLVITKTDQIQDTKEYSRAKQLQMTADNVGKFLKMERSVGRVFKVSSYAYETACVDDEMKRIHSIDKNMCKIWKSILNESYYKYFK